MELDKIIAAVSAAYDPDGTVLLHHNGSDCVGDGLASFIANEIKETYIEEDTTEDQLNEAWRVMIGAANQINSTIMALEELVTREINDDENRIGKEGKET